MVCRQQYNLSLEHRFSLQLLQTMQILAQPAQELRAQLLRETTVGTLLCAEPGREEIREETFPLEFEGQGFSQNGFRRQNGIITIRTGRKFYSPQKSITDIIEATSPSQCQLYDQIIEQIAFAKAPPKVIAIARTLAGELNEAGYLCGNAKTTGGIPLQADPAFADEFRKRNSIQKKDYDTAIVILQNGEPAGVGARFLGEALMLQLKDLECDTSIPETIINDHYDLFLVRDIDGLLDATGFSECQILMAYDTIRSLRPTPVDVTNERQPGASIMPEVYVNYVDEVFEIMLDGSMYPDLVLNDDYVERYKKVFKKDTGRRHTISSEKSRVSALVQALSFRKETLLDVVKHIVLHQEAFFRTGDKRTILPLLLKEVAGKVQICESTASRATKRHYAGTPWGVFELKKFFPQSVTRGDQPPISPFALEGYIDELIRRGVEDGTRFSGADLRGLLFDTYGISIARRTVTKYCNRLVKDKKIKSPSREYKTPKRLKPELVE